jgi:hypothetical protein
LRAAGWGFAASTGDFIALANEWILALPVLPVETEIGLSAVENDIGAESAVVGAGAA